MAAVMTGKQRVLAAIEGKPTDRLPLMPITMMFAADRSEVRQVCHRPSGDGRGADSHGRGV